MMLVMFFSTSTTLLTNYLTVILKVDTTHTYSLYIYLLPGYVVGAFICFRWFLRHYGKPAIGYVLRFPDCTGRYKRID